MENKKANTYVVPFADEHLIEGFVDELGYLSDCGIEFNDVMSAAVACSIDSAVCQRSFEESFQDMSAVESYSSDFGEEPNGIEEFVTPTGQAIPLGEVEARMCNAASYIGQRLTPYIGEMAKSMPQDAEIESLTARDRVLVRVKEVENDPREVSEFVQRVREKYGDGIPADSSSLVNQAIDDLTRK